MDVVSCGPTASEMSFTYIFSLIHVLDELSWLLAVSRRRSLDGYISDSVVIISRSASGRKPKQRSCFDKNDRHFDRVLVNKIKIRSPSKHALCGCDSSQIYLLS